MSALGHSRPGPAGRRSSHVRYAPKATVGHQNAIGRDGPTADSCTAAKRTSFDHLVGGYEQRARHTQAKSSGCPLVDHKLEFDRRLDRQIARIGAFQDAISVGCGAPVRVQGINPIGQQPAGRDEFSQWTDRWDAVSLSLRHSSGFLGAAG